MATSVVRIDQRISAGLAGTLLAAYVDSVGSRYGPEQDDPDDVAAWIAALPTNAVEAKRACADQLRLFGTLGQREDLCIAVINEGTARWRKWFPYG